jgi:uncharacterized protein
MTGETDLSRLLSGMTPVLHADTYVFATTTDPELARTAPSILRFEEAEGTTLILRQEDAAGLKVVFPCRRITLTIHSSLEAVGFMAAISAELTRLGIGANPVAGFYHDHLFIAADRADEAMAALQALSGAG